MNLHVNRLNPTIYIKNTITYIYYILYVHIKKHTHTYIYIR